MSFEVDLDELRAAVDGLAAFETTLGTRLADLDRAVSHLQATWSGEAASAQHEAHGRWTEGAQEMHEALGRLRAAADHAHRSYTRAAEANGSMWSQTR